MKGTKTCWNPMCVCWINEPDTSNCMTEDIEPQDCRLSGIDLRQVIDIFNTAMAPTPPTAPVESSDPNVPNIVHFYYMHSNHLFTPLRGRTLDQIVEHCNEIREGSYWGMLCPVILLRDETEIRRVGPSAHCHGSENGFTWRDNVSAWIEAVEKDKDIMRLLPTNKPYVKTTRG